MGLQKIFAALVSVLFFGGAVAADGHRARERAEIIIPEGWEQIYEEWKFAPADKIDNRVYVSGVVAAPRDGDLKVGYRNAWLAIAKTLELAGATLDDIVDITTFHTDIGGDFDDFRVVKDEFVKAPYPAWTAIGTTGLVVPEGVVEIKVVAHLRAH